MKRATASALLVAGTLLLLEVVHADDLSAGLVTEAQAFQTWLTNTRRCESPTATNCFHHAAYICIACAGCLTLVLDRHLHTIPELLYDLPETSAYVR